MTLQHIDTANQKVLWAKVWGLAAVQGAIALMWVIYNLYLVDLLTRFGLSAALATSLLIVENLLAMVMEPLMGSLSDRLQQQLGTRFPLISLGVILSAGIFIGLPAIALGGWGAGLGWLLPLLLVAWALAMTVFRSPALSLLGRYAFGTGLPQAASVLTLVGGVAGAMGPLASQRILSWGPVVAFGLGSGVLLLATAALRLTAPSQAPAMVEADYAPAPSASSPVSWRCLLLVFGTGIGISLAFRLIMTLFSTVLSQQVPQANTSLVLGSIFVTLALVALPAGALASRLGNRRAMLLGLAGMAFVCIAVSVVQQSGTAIAIAVLFGSTFSLVSNGTIPFALSMVPAPKAGLGTGMFFSGGAAASSLFGTLADTIQVQPPLVSALVGVLALLIAGLCITCAPRRSPVAGQPSGADGQTPDRDPPGH